MIVLFLVLVKLLVFCLSLHQSKIKKFILEIKGRIHQDLSSPIMISVSKKVATKL